MASNGGNGRSSGVSVWGGKQRPTPSTSPYQNTPYVMLESIPICVPYSCGPGPNPNYFQLPITVYTCQDPFCTQPPTSNPGPSYNFNGNPNSPFYSVPTGSGLGPIQYDPRPCCYLAQPFPQHSLLTMEPTSSSSVLSQMRSQLTSTTPPVPYQYFEQPSFAGSPISNFAPGYPVSEQYRQGFQPTGPTPDLGSPTSPSVSSPLLQVGPEVLRPQPLYTVYPMRTSLFGSRNLPKRQTTIMEEQEESHEKFPWSIDQEHGSSHCRSKGCWCGLKYSKYCKFCMGNNRNNMTFSFTHELRDKNGKLECPVLRSHVCQICGATGDDAHTIKFCPARAQLPGNVDGAAGGSGQ